LPTDHVREGHAIRAEVHYSTAGYPFQDVDTNLGRTPNCAAQAARILRVSIVDRGNYLMGYHRV